MKKIMLALGAIIAATAVNAASVDWSINLTGGGNGRIYDHTGSTIWSANTGATAYLVLNNQVEAFVGALNSDSALTGLYVGSTTAFKSASGVMTAVATATSDAITLASQSFNTILVYNDTDGNTWYKVSTVAESPARVEATDPSQLAWGSSTAIVPGEWTQAAPEPTSGLLLLLGVAGLALRRKKA